MKQLIAIFTVLVWSAIGLGLSSEDALAERRVALVVGNSVYKNAALALSNPMNDAQDISKVLRGLGFEVITALDAGKRDMDLALQKFARLATNADSALFFYAGHAMQHQGRNYLMPVDAELEDEVSLIYEMTAFEDVRAALDRSNGVKILILDACRNNPLADRLIKNVAGNNRALGSVRGLARIDKTQGMVVAYATAADDVAVDGSGRNSPFTKALLQRLMEPGLEIEMMFRRVAADVNSQTNGRQRPETYISLLNEYYLNQSDQLAWDQIKDSTDIPLLRDFVSRFPASPRSLYARNRIDMLERNAREREAQKREEEEQQRKAEAARRLADQEANKKFAEEKARLQQLEDLLRRQIAETQRLEAASAQKQQAESEVQRQANEAAQKQQAEVERQRVASEAAQQRLAETERQRLASVAAQKQQAEAERLRLAAESVQKQQAEAERQRLAGLAAQKQQADLERQRLIDACNREEQRFALLQAGGSYDELVRFMGELSCRSLRTIVSEAIARKAADANNAAVAVVSSGNVPIAAAKSAGTPESPGKPVELALATPKAPEIDVTTQVRLAQRELRRLGCYSGQETGDVNGATREAISRYLSRRGQSSSEIRITDELLSGLQAEVSRVCPLTCGRGQIASGDQCVAEPRNVKQPAPVARQPAASPRPVATQPAAPTPSASAVTNARPSPMVGIGN